MERCYDCAYCSTFYNKPGDICDKDEHVIENVYAEKCDGFEEMEDSHETD